MVLGIGKKKIVWSANQLVELWFEGEHDKYKCVTVIP